jgi:hypothetical protein
METGWCNLQPACDSRGPDGNVSAALNIQEYTLYSLNFAHFNRFQHLISIFQKQTCSSSAFQPRFCSSSSNATTANSKSRRTSKQRRATAKAKLSRSFLLEKTDTSCAFEVTPPHKARTDPHCLAGGYTESVEDCLQACSADPSCGNFSYAPSKCKHAKPLHATLQPTHLRLSCGSILKDICAPIK